MSKSSEVNHIVLYLQPTAEALLEYFNCHFLSFYLCFSMMFQLWVSSRLSAFCIKVSLSLGACYEPFHIVFDLHSILNPSSKGLSSIPSSFTLLRHSILHYFPVSTIRSMISQSQTQLLRSSLYPSVYPESSTSCFGLSPS